MKKTTKYLSVLPKTTYNLQHTTNNQQNITSVNWFTTINYRILNSKLKLIPKIRKESDLINAINLIGKSVLAIDKKAFIFKISVYSSFTYSKISAGWQSNTSQIVSSVLKRIAFAFPVFKIERLESVNPTFSESSLSDIFLLAIITSKFTIIAIIYTVKSFSFCNSTPREKIMAMT